MREFTTPRDGTPGFPGRSLERLSAPGTGTTEAKTQPPCKGGSDSKPPAEGAPLRGASINEAEKPKHDRRPTHDQLYLASKINDAASSRRLSPAAIQKLNTRYGVGTVSDALRSLHGFPPPELHSAYAYVEKVCKEGDNPC